VFNQDALFKGYKKRLEKLPKAKPGSEATRMVSFFAISCSSLDVVRVFCVQRDPHPPAAPTPASLVSRLEFLEVPQLTCVLA